MRKNISGALVVAATLFVLGPSLTVPGAQAGEAKLIPAAIDQDAGPVALKYPEAAQLRGEEGEIYMYVYIAADGRPTGRAKVVQSTGYDDLDNAALEIGAGLEIHRGQGRGRDHTFELVSGAYQVQASREARGQAPGPVRSEAQRLFTTAHAPTISVRSTREPSCAPKPNVLSMKSSRPSPC